MNEWEMTDLLQDATRDLETDVPALVADGMRRGRARQRRRHAGAVLATAAAVVLLGAGGVRLLDEVGGATRGVAPAAPVPTESPSVRDREPPAPVDLGVTTAQVPDRFATLVPGEVSAPAPKSGPDSAPVVDFTWEGFGIRVGLTPDDYVAGHSVPDPARRCADQEPSGRCQTQPDGTVIAAAESTNPAVDGGTVVRSVTVFRPDGWDVVVMAYNGPGKEGPATADQPPLDLDQLEAVAASDVWFR